MLKCIQAGLGGRGRGWLGILKVHPDVDLVACADPSEANRQIAKAEFGIPDDCLYSSLEDAVRENEVEWLMDVTPPAVHSEVADLAFEHGLHILGEKPLSDSYDKARTMVAKGREAGVRHMITQNYRFGAFPRTARRVISEGLIGKPEQCDIKFYCPWADVPGSHYVTEPYMLINDMMVHHFDMIRYILGATPEAVTAITWNHSWGWHKGDAAHMIVFEFPNNLHVTHVACGCAVGDSKTEWRIEGPKGSLSWDESRLWHSHLHRVPEPIRKDIPLDKVVWGEEAVLNEFLAALRGNRDPECSSRDNLNSVKMVFAAIKSAEEHRRVRLDELDRM